MKSLFAGRHAPLYSTAGGRAILSHMPHDDVRHILMNRDRPKITPHTVTEIDQIMQMVAQAREDGFASAWQETRIGEVVAASAVLDVEGMPIGAIHVSTSVEGVKKRDIKSTIAPIAVTVAHQITQDIQRY